MRKREKKTHTHNSKIMPNKQDNIRSNETELQITPHTKKKKNNMNE